MKITVISFLLCGMLLACANPDSGSGSSNRAKRKRDRQSEKISLDSQWRGPERSGVYADVGLLKEWPENGPNMLFATDGLGKSYSSAVATDEAIFVTGLKDSEEYLTSLDLDGNIIWQKSYGEGWDMSFPEARCTPTVEGNRVYVLSAKDNLVCFNTESGEVIWEVDIQGTYFSEWDMFGVSESLLLIDDKIIVSPCGKETTVIALDKMTGDLIWKSEALDEPRAYISPILYSNDSLGLKQIITANQTHLLGVNPDNGDIIWKYFYNFFDEDGEILTVIANTPLYKGTDILISNGWDFPLKMIELTAEGVSVREKYENLTFDNQNHGMVRIGDYVYGSNYIDNNYGKWVCMRWDDGKIMYEEDWNCKGPIISADGMLYLLDERKGNMGLAKASPDGLNVISSFKVKKGKGPFWARPTIYHGMLLVRHGDFLLAYDLKEDSSI